MLNTQMRSWIALIIIAAGALTPLQSWASDDRSLEDVLLDLPVIRGAPLTSSDIDGQVLLIAFFASWCPPCKYEFPHLNKVQKAYRNQGVRIVAINVFETFDGLSTPAKLEVFLDMTKPIFPILRGDEATRRIFGNLDRIPTMFLFGRDGDLDFIFRHERNAEKTHLSEAELRAAIEPLL